MQVPEPRPQMGRISFLSLMKLWNMKGVAATLPEPHGGHVVASESSVSDLCETQHDRGDTQTSSGCRSATLLPSLLPVL